MSYLTMMEVDMQQEDYSNEDKFDSPILCSDEEFNVSIYGSCVNPNLIDGYFNMSFLAMVGAVPPRSARDFSKPLSIDQTSPLTNGACNIDFYLCESCDGLNWRKFIYDNHGFLDGDLYPWPCHYV